MNSPRRIVGAVVFIAGVALVGLSILYATQESYEFGRLPFLVLGAISAAAGLALGGLGILIVRGRSRGGSLVLLVTGLVALGVVLSSVSGLLLFALIPIAAALLLVARGFVANGYRRRTA